MREFCTNKIIWDSSPCLLSGVERLSVSRRLEVYYFCTESNLCFVNCLLYGVCPYLGVSVMRGFTVL